ncbi:MAG: protoporphyrinogen oxidase HemJ [Mariprofundaceae bacterium]|nr:protoporphyrinogen oxidase HemJ [Mariprofundaceae bacterium]
MIFLWLKAFHIIAMVSWFAGLFYLPRLFVYHAGHHDGAVHEQFMVMERKLYRYIMWPAMLITIGCGLALVHLGWAILVDSVWFWLKMGVVLVLLLFHLHNGRVIADFAAKNNHYSHTFFRKYNEIPTISLLIIVVLVVVRPF